MVENFVRVERYEDGVLVNSQTYPKPPEQFNAETITERAVQALATNATIVTAADEFLAIPAPTNAQLAAQVRDLTTAAKLAAQQRNGLVRLALQRFDSAD
jgi:hypothetical protein